MCFGMVLCPGAEICSWDASGGVEGDPGEVPKRIAVTLSWKCFGMVLCPGEEIWLWDASGKR